MRRAGSVILVASLLAPSMAGADFNVTGTFQYEDRQYDAGGFTGGTANLPIRFADVEVVDSIGGMVLASGATDSTGRFSITNVPAAAEFDVQVRCITSTVRAADLDVEVRDDPANVATASLWSISTTYPNHDPDADIDFTAAPILARIYATFPPPATPGDGPGGAFNVFDRLIDGSNFVKALNGAVAPELIVAHWQYGVEVGTAFRATGHRIMVNGGDGDRDEYDDPVLLHEYGHAVAHLFWQMRSPGGTHHFLTHGDPRLALSEGWAGYFSSAVRNEDFYVDVAAGGPFNQHSLESGSRFNYNAFGSDNEISVAMALWDISDAADDDNDCMSMGHDEIWDVFRNYLSAPTLAKTFEDFYHGWSARGHPQPAEIEQEMNGRVMEFVANPHTRIFENDFADVAIPDNSAAGVTSSLTISDDWTINTIADDAAKQQSYSIAAYVEIDHEQPDTDLVLELTHPDGTTVTLFDKGAGGDANVANFSKGGANGGIYAWFGLTPGPLVDGWPAWLHPVPLGGMTALDGKNFKGRWRLTVADTTATHSGTFRAWRLMFVPSDWYDAVNAYGNDVRHRNALYEWLGVEASHEAGASDAKDADGANHQNLVDADGSDDGVRFTGEFKPGQTVTVDFDVTTIGAKQARYRDADQVGKRRIYVRGWFDWNRDGVFGDPAERMVDWSDSPVDWPPCQISTSVSVPLVVPPAAAGGQPWTRFRLTYDTPPLPTGEAEFGEVEDYATIAGFLCYGAKDKNRPPQDPGHITLEDQFDGSIHEPRPVRLLCTPAAEDLSKVADAATHLKSYGLVEVPLPAAPSPIPRCRPYHARTQSRFGAYAMKLAHGGNLTLMVPTSKSLDLSPAPPPDPPDRATHSVEHFKCYRSKLDAKAGPRFPHKVEIRIEDQFGTRTLRVLKPRRVCVPADKNVEGIKDRHTHLVCYAVKQSLSDPTTIHPPLVQVNNQFGPELLELGNAEELCLPAEKELLP